MNTFANRSQPIQPIRPMHPYQDMPQTVNSQFQSPDRSTVSLPSSNQGSQKFINFNLPPPTHTTNNMGNYNITPNQNPFLSKQNSNQKAQVQFYQPQQQQGLFQLGSPTHYQNGQAYTNNSFQNENQFNRGYANSNFSIQSQNGQQQLTRTNSSSIQKDNSILNTSNNGTVLRQQQMVYQNAYPYMQLQFKSQSVPKQNSQSFQNYGIQQNINHQLNLFQINGVNHDLSMSINNSKRGQVPLNSKQRNQSRENRENDSVRFSENTKSDDETEYIGSQTNLGGFLKEPQPSMFRKVSQQNRNLSEGGGINMLQSYDKKSSNSPMKQSTKLRKQKSMYKYNSDMLSDLVDIKSLNYQFIDNTVKTNILGGLNQKQSSYTTLNSNQGSQTHIHIRKFSEQTYNSHANTETYIKSHKNSETNFHAHKNSDGSMYMNKTSDSIVDSKGISIFSFNHENRWVNKSLHCKFMKKLETLSKVIESKYGVQEKQGSIDIFITSIDAKGLKENLINRVKTQIKVIKGLEQVVHETSKARAKELQDAIKIHTTKKNKIKKLAEEGRSDLDLEGQLKEIHKQQLDMLVKLDQFEYKYDFGGFSDQQKRSENVAKLEGATPKEHRKITSELLQSRLADAREQCEATKYVISQVKQKDFDMKFKRQNSSKGSPEFNQKSQVIADIPFDSVISDTIYLITQSLPDFKNAWSQLIQEEIDTSLVLKEVQMGFFNLEQARLFKQIKYEPIKKQIQKYLHVVFLDLRLPIRRNYELNSQIFDCYIKILEDISENLNYYITLVDKTMKNDHSYYFSQSVLDELKKSLKYLQFVLNYNKTNISNIKSLKNCFQEIVNPYDSMHKHKSLILSMNHPNISQKDAEKIFETHKNAKDIQIQIQQSLSKLDVEKICGMCTEFDIPSENYQQILRDQIDRENNSVKRSIKFIESYVTKYRHVESEEDAIIKKLQNQGLNLLKQWEQVDDGKMRFQLQQLEIFYKQLTDVLQGIGSHVYDSQVRCYMSDMNFKKAQKIYLNLKQIHKKVLKHVFLQKEIHMIDLKVFQNLVHGLDLTDAQSEGEFKKYCNMIQGIQTVLEIEQDNVEFKSLLDINIGFFKLIELIMNKHNLFKRAYEKPQEYVNKIGPEYSIDSLCDAIRDICLADRSLQKSLNTILSFSQEFHKRCTEQINKKAIENNISAKNQLIDKLTIQKNDIYSKIEKFYYYIFESEQTYEIVGGVENVYQSNNVDFNKFQDEIKSLQRKFKNQPLHFQVLDGYQLEAQQNILLTKYFIGLNTFLIKKSQSVEQTSRTPTPTKNKLNIHVNTNSHNEYDFSEQINSLYKFNAENKIESYLKKRKNVNSEIYHRFETHARHFYQFFEYALECNKQRIAFTQYFDNCKKQIDLGNPQFIQNLKDCLELKDKFDSQIENHINQMKQTKLNSIFLFSKHIIEKIKFLVKDSFNGYNFTFLKKLNSIINQYKECHMNYVNAYQEVKAHILKEQKKKQIKDFLDDLHSVYIPKVRVSLANSIINWQNFNKFIPEVQDSNMFDEMRFINQKFENHKHKNCEAFFASIYDIIHLYIQQKSNTREQKQLMQKMNDKFQKHNQTYQMNLQRDLSNIFETLIKDDHVLSRNFRN